MELKDFENWINAKKNFLASSGVKDVEVNYKNIDTIKPSIEALFVKENNNIGMITIWTSGEVDVAVMDIVSEEYKLYKNFSVKEKIEFDECFADFFNVLFS